MRILVSTMIYPNASESTRGIYIHEQIKVLQKMGLDIQVFAPIPYIPKFITLASYKNYSTIPRKEVIDSIHIIHPRFFIFPKILTFIQPAFYFFSLFFQFRKTVYEFKPDIILGYWAYPDGISNLLFSKIFKLPVVIGCRGSDINVNTKYALKKVSIAWALKKSNKVLSVSEALKKVIISIGIEKNHVKVIRNGIDYNKFFPMPLSEARKEVCVNLSSKVILFVGRLSEEKCVDILIKAFEGLSGTLEAELYLIGDGIMGKSWIELAQSVGSKSSIHFIGRRPASEISLWMNAADVVVLPSKREGCPNVLLESFACGKPVVASCVGGIPEIVTNNRLGILVEPGNEEALCAALHSSLMSDWDHEFIRRYAKTRSWDDVGMEVLEELRKYFDASN